MPSTQHFAPDNPSTRPRSKNNEARLWIFLVAAVALLLAVVATGLILTISPQSSQAARPSSDEEVDSTADLATYLIEGHEAAIAGWGNGQYGQLGSAQFIKDAPRAITEATPDGGTSAPIVPDLGDLVPEEIDQLYAEESYAIAVTNSGDLYYWGGPSDTGMPGPFEGLTTTPTLFATADDFGGQKVAQLALSIDYVVALTENNELYSWGSNAAGGLGIGKPETDQELEARPDHDMYYEIQRVKTDATGGNTIVEIDGGTSHTLALDDQGTVYAWGNGMGGQLGDEETYTGATANYGAAESGAYEPVVIDTGALSDTKTSKIAAGGHHSLALTADHEVVAWGSNYLGQIGDAHSVSEETSFEAPQTTTLAEDITAESGSEIVDLVTAQHSSYAITASGEVYGWGSNEYDQLSVNVANEERSHEANPDPEQIGGDLAEEKVIDLVASRYHVLALTENNTLFTWGLESYEALGPNAHGTGESSANGTGGLTTVATPIQVPLENDRAELHVRHIAVGAFFSLAHMEQ